MAKTVSILMGRRRKEIVYWKVFADREKAEIQKKACEDYDKFHNIVNWEYFIRDEIIIF